MSEFQGILNARDLGGLSVGENRKIRPGIWLRTGRLAQMTPGDRECLERQWQVQCILDLRNEQEIAEYPDLPLCGAKNYRIPIFEGEMEGVSREEGGEDKIGRAILRARRLQRTGAENLLRQSYEEMVTDPHCVRQLREVFRILFDQAERGTGAVLWHCTSGKDRTGVVAALLLWSLGTSWETILEDYLLTNDQTADHRSEVCRRMAEHGASAEEVRQIEILESVRADYLEACKAAIGRKYGSVDAFLEKELMMTPERRAQLLERTTFI